MSGCEAPTDRIDCSTWSMDDVHCSLSVAVIHYTISLSLWASWVHTRWTGNNKSTQRAQTPPRPLHFRPVNWIYTVSKKTGPLPLIWHNFINSQHSLKIFLAQRDFIQFSIRGLKKFSNWLRTSCVVFIATVATWRSVFQKTGPCDILT